MNATIADLVPEYIAVGISARAAVRYIVDSHLRSDGARGRGNSAARRAAHAETAHWAREHAREDARYQIDMEERRPWWCEEEERP